MWLASALGFISVWRLWSARQTAEYISLGLRGAGLLVGDRR